MFATDRPGPPSSLTRIARAARAGPDEDVMVWARRLGFDLLPCACRGDCAHTTAAVVAFDPLDETRTMRRAVARGLLLRARQRVTEATIQAVLKEIGA